MKDLCKPDPRNSVFNITPETLEESLSKVKISRKVPKKIQEMLEFSKKICLYGYYEYDFYTLSSVYLFLLTETAIKERFLNELPKKCHLRKKNKLKEITKNYRAVYDHLWKGWSIEGYEKVNRSLGSILKWLYDHQVLPKRVSEFETKTLKNLRNESAHLTRKNILTPGMVIPILWKVIDFVNCLFDPKVHNKEPESLRRTREFYTEVFQEAKKITKKSKKK